MTFTHGVFALAAVTVAGALLLLLMHINPAVGHDAVRPELNSWFSNLANQKRLLCCSVSDGTAVLDVDWESVDGKYRVRIDGKWIDIPTEALITAPNRYGPAVVWRFKDQRGDTQIRCFIPGAGT